MFFPLEMDGGILYFRDKHLNPPRPGTTLVGFFNPIGKMKLFLAVPSDQMKIVPIDPNTRFLIGFAQAGLLDRLSRF